MLFNSFGFLIFFPIVVIGYYLLQFIEGGGKSLSNSWLLIANYYFYLNLNSVYGLILVMVTLTTYGCGLALDRLSDSSIKKLTLTVCLLLNFSSLFVFKYYNFLTEAISSLLSYCSLEWNFSHLSLLLPIGISFFTFQAAGYIIDVYKGNIKAERDILTYSLFVSFFPEILAGPIQKARVLIPQIKEKLI